MLTIIFGAGASYDSSPDFKTDIYAHKRLPLAKEFFSTRFAHIAKGFPIAFSPINRLRRAPNIEQELETISTESGSNTPEQLLKIRRYINQVIAVTQIDWEDITQRNTVYYELLDTLQKWQEDTKKAVNLITFNYDALLDAAYRTLFKNPLKDLKSYLFNNTPCKLFKPNGSTDWIHLAQLPYGVTVNGDTDHLANQLVWTPYFGPSSSTGVYKAGYYKFPAISIPTQTKNKFEFPNIHKEEMIKAIANTAHLLSIGWKAEEKHFLKLWGSTENAKKLTNIEVVNSDSKRVSEIVDNIKRHGNMVSSDITTYSGGFANYVPDAFSRFLKKL